MLKRHVTFPRLSRGVFYLSRDALYYVSFVAVGLLGVTPPITERGLEPTFTTSLDACGSASSRFGCFFDAVETLDELPVECQLLDCSMSAAIRDVVSVDIVIRCRYPFEIVCPIVPWVFIFMVDEQALTITRYESHTDKTMHHESPLVFALAE